MASFKKIKNDLQQIRQQREDQRQAIFRAQEELKHINIRKATLLRSGAGEEYKLLLEREQALRASLAEQRKRLAKITKKQGAWLEGKQPFPAPHKQIRQLSDNFPILLFPVRLETRFKKIPLAGAVQHQLWVRIFPDDCSIDTFEGTLTESEVKNVKNYWISLWKAGQSPAPDLQPYLKNLKKGAWRTLAGSTQAGRAYWVIRQYQPLNLEALPLRQLEEEVILVIPAETLPEAAEQTALITYWQAIWAANGAAGGSQAAQEVLIAALGQEKAVSLIQTYSPVNIQRATPAAAVPPAQVAFVLFPKAPDTETKHQSWSQAPRVTTFPERFLLMGYRNNEEVMPSQVGALIPDPLIIGPDPQEDINEVLREAYQNGEIGDGSTSYEDLKEEDKAGLYVEYLSRKADTKWLFDFETAVANGLGFKVNLTGEQYQEGFDRLLVLGVRLGADEQEGRKALETLIQHHHFGTNGFAILPQGTPTNNTESSGAGYSGTEDPDESFERYVMGSTEEDPQARAQKKDGRWLAELLGIDAEAATLKQVANYYQTDQSEALAMDTALWPATWGYFMESLLTPVFSDWDRSITRWFFTNHVIGRGRMPAIRIGRQPYGILPTAAISRFKWLSQPAPPFEGYANAMPVLGKLYQLLSQVRGDWLTFQNQVPQVGLEDPDRDAHQLLMEVLGLQASSQEFYQRYAQGFLHLYNYLLWIHPHLGRVAFGGALSHSLSPRRLLRNLGYDANQAQTQPPIFEKSFFSSANLLKGPVIDDRPLSEILPIRPYTDAGQNYIEWLIEGALTNHDRVRQQEGFTNNQPPRALLYQMLRHALNLSFSDTGFHLYRRAQILDEAELQAARVDADFIGFNSTRRTVASKWEYLYRPDDRITHSNITVAQYISNLLKEGAPADEAGNTGELVQALQYLARVPTARLERAFAEHLDGCTYRLDAWLLGLVNMQLFGMRYKGDFGAEGEARQGVYLGAFGWVENLRPDDRTLSPVELPEDLNEIFNSGKEPPLVKDDTNAGYIHAPSLNQAVTAAVLRNAYLSNASAANPDAFKVNLSSERVRMAMGIIEGMQQGQPLGALLGYQLERGLHDRYQQAEVDVYIYELRKAFPLQANRLTSTAVAEADLESVTQTEARNVVDGLALVEHIQQTGNASYPFGKDLQPAATADQQAAIDAEVARIRNINDAVADLAMAESVHQVVQGNYDRAAGTLDAYSKGNYPQIPEVVQTPRSGVTLTHRVGIHLPQEASAPPQAPVRVLAEPALNAWLATLLPPAADIVCQLAYQLPSGEPVNPNPPTERVLSMAQLGLAPLDLIYVLGVAEDKSLTALDDGLLRHLYTTEALRPDMALEIQYTRPVAGKVSFFELAPLVGNLRSLLLAARPLRPSDLHLPNEAHKAVDEQVFLDPARVQQPLDQLASLIAANQPEGSVQDFLDLIPGDLEDPTAQATVIDAIDTYIGVFADQLHRVSAFGIPQAGFGFVYERRKSIYAAIAASLQAYGTRWEEKLAAYEDLVTTQYTAAATEEERFAILQRAERAISTTYTSPLPATAAQFKADLAAGKEVAFRTKLATIQALLAPPFLLTLSGLSRAALNLSALAPPLLAFDSMDLDIADEIKQILLLAQDMVNQARKLILSVTDKISKAENLMTEHNSLADPNRRAELLMEAGRMLFGEDFKMYPAFALSPPLGSELVNCLNNTGPLLAYQKTDLSVDFPVDDWLYGIARVREKMGQWENVAVLAEGFRGDLALDLTPLQLPYRAEDTWLALSYPDTVVIDQDKLLYTAHLTALDPGKPQAGILIDEWTEVIPTRNETTGLAFHFDKPNQEPPQSLLLVTPTQFTGHWEWTDLVFALHETLDLAQLRAIEPSQIDNTPYAHFLPATVSAVTYHPASIAVNYAINNNLTTE